MTNKPSITKQELILSVIISIFSVIFLWGFWNNGISALGFNATIFWTLFLGLFSLQIKEKKDFLMKHYSWIVPIFIIILSFSIYENPYIKKINFFILPILIIFFLNFSITKFSGIKIWNLSILNKIINKKISIKDSKNEILNIKNKGNNKTIIIKKILLGTGIFIFINIIIASLLSSADENFGRIIGELLDIISIISIYKIIISFLILILLIAFKLSWKQELIIENNKKEKNLDSIISGIVIGGTLFTYIIFIFSQIENIFIPDINITQDFGKIVTFVKGGFWELFFVSIINIIFFFVYYKKTIPSIQKILITFIIASIIILISASNRMYYYITNYGLSYEKFTASYTVLYFGILFILMISFLFRKSKTDILKTSIILALCMYAGLNIIPMERIIFNTNLSLSTGTKSHILTHKYQSHMLSTDIIKDVKGLEGTKIFKDQSWDLWVERKHSHILNKKWYEKNINNL